MDKHVHEWEIKCVGGTIFAYVGREGNYKATMGEAEILARLNATERLSAEDARFQSPAILNNKFRSDLLAYADAREGK